MTYSQITYTIDKANDYIASHQHKVVDTYRNQFHMMTPIGWLNDPNGFVYYKGEYHLFYQFYPYESAWGPMHWGHVKSKDLVHWQHLPVALAPDQPYDRSGCFSGSAIVKEDRLFLMYTGHVETDEGIYQTQCMAVSNDGIHFEKLAKNPIIGTKELAGQGSIHDFRDPKMLLHEGNYYSVVASKTEDNRGKILLFESSNLIEWSFKSVLLEGEAGQGNMWECPDLFHLDGQDVLIISPIQWQAQGEAYTNISSTVAFIGEVDWHTGQFREVNHHEIDNGMDFYAPQTCEDDAGRRIMIAWMQMWHRTFPTHTLAHSWAGSMTLPRELHIEGNRLVQRPISFIYDTISIERTVVDQLVDQDTLVYRDVLAKPTYLNIQVDVQAAKNFTIALAPDTTQALLLTYDYSQGTFRFNRAGVGHTLVGEEIQPYEERQRSLLQAADELNLEIFKDTSSIEVFINGEAVMTNTFYEIEAIRHLKFMTEGTAEIKRMQIGVID